MIKAVAEDGKLREMLMIPIKFLNGWLFGKAGLIPAFLMPEYLF